MQQIRIRRVVVISVLILLILVAIPAVLYVIGLLT
jgi:hypothetical protein